MARGLAASVAATGLAVEAESCGVLCGRAGAAAGAGLVWRAAWLAWPETRAADRITAQPAPSSFVFTDSLRSRTVVKFMKSSNTDA